MSEIPQPQIVKSPNHLEVESPAVSRKLKTDALDRYIQGYNSAVQAAGGVVLGVGLMIPGLTEKLINGFNRPDFPAYLALSSIAGLTTAAASFYYKPLESASRFRQAGKIETQHSIQNPAPDYIADRIVYRGGGLDANGFRLNKGDNLYYVHLPIPKAIGQDNPTTPIDISPEQLGLLSSYYSLILKDLRGKTAQRDFQAVVLDFGYVLHPENPNLKKYGDASLVPSIQLFEGKNIANNKTSTTVLLPREVLDALPLSPKDIFNKAVDALEADIGVKITGRELVSRLRNLGKTPEDARMEEAIALRHRLDNLFNMQAESRFNTLPNVSIERTPLGPVRKKSQIHPLLKVTQNSKGVFLEEISYLSGDRRFLVKLDIPIEEALKSGSKNRVLLLTYAISEMLSTPEKIMEFTEEETIDPLEIEKKLRKTGISLSLPGKLSVYPKSHKFLKGARDIAIAGVIGIGAINAVSTIPAIPEIPHILSIDLPFGLSGTSQTGERNGNISLNHLEDKEKTGLPGEGIPGSHLDWRIYEHGLSANGYYIQSTSQDYKEGGWAINNRAEDAKELNTNTLSSSIKNENGDYMQLQGIVNLDFFKNARFRIPIKEGTTLSGLVINDLEYKDINPSSYRVYKFKDGTFMIDISLDKLSTATSVNIIYNLVESEDGPHAVQRIAPIDISKLTPEAYRLLQQSGNNLDNLREKVSLDKPYSINPPNKDVLNGLDGSEEAVINAIERLDGSDCDTSNTQFALLSSAVATSDFVNTASGYLGISAGGFLNSNKRHRFNVTNSGSIIDATAGNGTLGDETTREYIESLNQTSNMDVDEAYSQWEQNIEAEKQKQMLLGNIQLILELGGLAGALAIAPKGIEAIRRKITKDRVDRARNKARALPMLRRASVSDMEEAYRFFNWMSFGEGRQFARFSEVPVEFSSREEMAKRIKKGVLEHNLRSYLQKPEDFEQQAGIKNPGKLRRIARYLLY